MASIEQNLVIVKFQQVLGSFERRGESRRGDRGPSLQRRDVLIFDYRILHRGRANVSVNERPILVLAYAKSWFKDILNFLMADTERTVHRRYNKHD